MKKQTEKKYKQTIKDLEFIIKLQENYIDKVEVVGDEFMKSHIEGWMHNIQWREENAKLEKELEETNKAYYEVTRAYNALAEAGKFAIELGIDIKKHQSELPENRWKDWTFEAGQTILESGKIRSHYKIKPPKEKNKDE